MPDDTSKDVAPDVQENEDEAPNPLDQIGVILQLLFMYTIQGATLQIPRTLGVHMAREVDQCEDAYHIQTYLDNVWWPFSLKILFAPLVDFIPLRCFKRKYHRRAYICVTGLISAGIFLSLAFSWNLIDPDHTCPKPELLFLHLFVIVLSTAIGDVALDGLSVLSLQGKNIGYFALIQSVGDTVGTTGSGNAFLFFERKIGVQWCFIVFATLILTVLFCAANMKERAAESSTSTTPVFDSYKELYGIFRNRNALYFGLTVMALFRAWQSGFASQVDLKNIGYTKDDIIIVSFIEVVPTIVTMMWITQYVNGSGNQIKKLKILYPMFVFGQALYFATLTIPPYVNAVTNGNDKESWVFPFRTITNIIAIPFNKVAGLVIVGFASKITPTSCPGTFMTLMMTLMNLGPRLVKSATNPMRNLLTYLAKASGNGICNGSKDNLYQGRLEVCINTAQFEKTGTTMYEDCNFANTTLRRFCGKVTCEPDEYCNKLGDGYVLFGIICITLGVLYYVLFISVIARKVDKEKIDYDPKNLNERLAWCPKTCCGANMDADDADFEEVYYDDNSNRKTSYIELA